MGSEMCIRDSPTALPRLAVLRVPLPLFLLERPSQPTGVVSGRQEGAGPFRFPFICHSNQLRSFGTAPTPHRRHCVPDLTHQQRTCYVGDTSAGSRATCHAPGTSRHGSQTQAALRHFAPILDHPHRRGGGALFARQQVGAGSPILMRPNTPPKAEAITGGRVETHTLRSPPTPAWVQTPEDKAPRPWPAQTSGVQSL